MKKISLVSMLTHLAVFLVVELVFVLLVFREFPSISLVSLTGILHLSYWAIVIGAGLIRELYAKAVWHKFFCTYFPVVYHIVIHVYLGRHLVHDHHGHDHHHDHEMGRIIVGTIIAGGLIALGEYRLHRTSHCATHHQQAHQHCHDSDCTDGHQ